MNLTTPRDAPAYCIGNCFWQEQCTVKSRPSSRTTRLNSSTITMAMFGSSFKKWSFYVICRPEPGSVDDLPQNHQLPCWPALLCPMQATWRWYQEWICNRLPLEYRNRPTGAQRCLSPNVKKQTSRSHRWRRETSYGRIGMARWGYIDVRVENNIVVKSFATCINRHVDKASDGWRAATSMEKIACTRGDIFSTLFMHWITFSQITPSLRPVHRPMGTRKMTHPSCPIDYLKSCAEKSHIHVFSTAVPSWRTPIFHNAVCRLDRLSRSTLHPTTYQRVSTRSTPENPTFRTSNPIIWTMATKDLTALLQKALQNPPSLYKFKWPRIHSIQPTQSPPSISYTCPKWHPKKWSVARSHHVSLSLLHS